MSFQDTPEFLQKNGTIQHENFIVVNTTGINYFSIIFEAFNEAGEPVNFDGNSYYKIYCSNTAWDEPYDPYDYEHLYILPPDDRWTFIRSIHLGNNHVCTNEYNNNNQGDYGNPLHFKYAKFTTPEIPNVKVRITVGTR